METKHAKRGGNAFLWGLIIGVLLTTLLTTKRGRQILREITNLGLESLEDFVEEKTKHSKGPIEDEPVSPTTNKRDSEDIEEATEDIESQITEFEEIKETAMSAESVEEPVLQQESGEPMAQKNGNGHKKRLFKGIRRK